MKQQIKNHALLIVISLIFSFVSSAALLLCIPAIKSDSSFYLIVIPMMFWGGLVAEQCVFWRANWILKSILSEGHTRQIHIRPGIICPLQTILGTIADLTFAISLIVYIVLVVINVGTNTIQFLLLFLIVLSFRVHCIANGKNYWYKKYFLHRRD